MDWLVHNYQGVLAFVAILGVLVNFFSMSLQRQRDSSEEISKRIEAASKIAKAATDLMSPLENRVDDLEKDNARFEELVKAQGEQFLKLQKQYDEQHYELRAVKADRDNMLQRILILQKQNDLTKNMVLDLQNELSAQKTENSVLTVQVSELQSKLSLQAGENAKLEEKLAEVHSGLIVIQNQNGLRNNGEENDNARES